MSFLLIYPGESLWESTAIEESSEYAFYAAPLDVGRLKISCIDGIGVVVVVVTASDVFADDAVVVRTLGNGFVLNVLYALFDQVFLKMLQLGMYSPWC